MSWLQLRLKTDSEKVAALEDYLLGSGAVAVTLQDDADQPVLEPGVGETPLWQQIYLTGLFPADADMDAVRAAIPDRLYQPDAVRVEILEDKDWEREWMQHYQPMQFGNRLWVCPSWLQPPDPAAVNLLLDPGLAFGTGTHPTTELCLRELDAMELVDATVVDYGCGSGILAIAALKLGAKQALGVDNDPQALAASRDNAERNGIGVAAFPLLLPQKVEGAAWAGCADLVLANILAGPLVDLSNTLLAFARPQATVLLSGLLQTQAMELIDHYAPILALHVAAEKDGWVCLRGRLGQP